VRSSLAARLFDLVADAIIVAGDADEIIFVNHQAEELFGYGTKEIAGRALGTLISPVETPRQAQALQPFRTQSLVLNQGAEIVGRRRDGQQFFAEASITPARQNEARIRILVLRDISARKQEEDHMRAALKELSEAVEAKSLLLDELHHRMKNNHQVILSMIRLQKARPIGLEAKAELNNMETRIAALSGVGGELLLAREDQPIDLSTYLRHLVGKLKDVFCLAPLSVAFRLDLEDIKVPAKTAANIGLLINEAITNSFKHAVPKGATEISVGLSRNHGNILLTIGDNGPGPGLDPSRHVGGTALMLLLAKQLMGTIELDRSGRGMRYLIRFPAC
jgi:PAS domain S-box-containing protein